MGILSVVLRTVISCGRDEYGAVEKTLKGILTICTLLVFPVVVALWWTIYIGVKRFRYGGSVVPAMPSASGIRVFTMKLRGVAPPECQFVLSGCTIMFQWNFECSPSFPKFHHNPDAGTV